MKKFIPLVVLCLLLGSVVWAAVIVNGKTAPFEVYENDGVLYAPIKQMAKALGASVTTDNQGNIKISTSSAGGAYQIKSVEGTIAQTLFNGITRFTVNGIETTEESPQGAKPWSINNKFVLIAVEVKNGSKKARNYGYAVHKMTLVDDKGQLYANDAMKQESDWTYMVGYTELLPGAFLKGKYVFEIPKDATPVRIVFEPKTEKNEKAFRVNLKEE